MSSSTDRVPRLWDTSFGEAPELILPGGVTYLRRDPMNAYIGELRMGPGNNLTTARIGCAWCGKVGIYTLATDRKCRCCGAPLA